MNKLDYFKGELELITDKEVKEFTVDMLLKVPDYFFKVAASSTSKYHPSFAQGEQGLVRHTKAAVRIAHEMLRNDMFKPFLDKASIIYSALLLHDSIKHGLNGSSYTVATHPLEAADFIRKNTSASFLEIANEVATLIEPHMGQWNTDYKTRKEILPKPRTKIENFVHLADYLASRKCLEHNFEADLSK